MRPAVVLERHASLAIRILIVGLLFVGGVYAYHALASIILPLLFAMLLTALLSPVVDKLDAHMRRGLAVTVVVVLFLVFVFGSLAFIVPALFDQASEAVAQAEKGIAQIPEVARDIGLDAQQTQDLFTQASDRLRDNLGSISGAVTKSAATIASVTVSIGFGAFLTFVLLVYLLIDGRGFWDGAVRLLDADRRKAAHRSGVRAWHALRVFIRSQVFVAAFDAIGIAAGLFALGVPLVLPLGVLTFILSFVPYIGATVSGILVALVALSTVGPGAMLGILAIAIIVQMVEGHLVYPLLVGRSLRLHPITVLVAVGTGSAVLGILGAFFATPILATVAAAAGLLPDPMSDETEAPHTERADAHVSTTKPEPSGGPVASVTTAATAPPTVLETRATGAPPPGPRA